MSFNVSFPWVSCELKFFTGFFFSFSASQTFFAYYIGLKDVVGDNNISSHKWLRDGSSLTFQNWYTGQPATQSQTCVTQIGIGQWTDVPCYVSFGSICELINVSVM